MNLGRLFDAVGNGPIFWRHQRNQALGGILPMLPVKPGFKHRTQPVVVDLRNGIIPVVVALCALDRHTQQRRGNDLKGVGNDLMARQLGLGRTISSRIWGHAQKTRGHQPIEIPTGQIG